MLPGRVAVRKGRILLEIRRATDAPQPVRPYRGGMADRDISSSEARQRAGWGIGIALGMGVGVAMGAALGNMGLGIGIGVGVGIAFAVAFGATGRGGREGQPDESALGSEPSDAPGPESPRADEQQGESGPEDPDAAR